MTCQESVSVPPMKHILLVDDDTLVLALMTRALPDFNLTIARDGDEALAIASQHRIDLLITDYLMPSMTGDELIGRLRERRPELKVLVVTGHGQVLAREDPDWWQSEAHLAKPFRVDALREAVISLIGLPLS
jgi:two-component system cell cycle sensor histidine kinase/response regulator CckA